MAFNLEAANKQVLNKHIKLLWPIGCKTMTFQIAQELPWTTELPILARALSVTYKSPPAG